MIKKIITHDGSFHVDEVFAIAMVKYFIKNNVAIIRTRSKNFIEKEKYNPETMIIDVGGTHDPDNLLFDHHQGSFDLKWTSKDGVKDEVPLSSTGLVFLYLLNNGYLANLDDKALNFFKKNYVINIDAMDNGIKFFEELAFIFKFNKKNGDCNENYQQFQKSLKMTCTYLKNIIENAKEISETQKQTYKALKNTKQLTIDNHVYNVVIVPQNSSINIKTCLNQNPNIDFFINKKDKNQYKIRTAPLDLNKGFSQKHPVPTNIINAFETKKHNIKGLNLNKIDFVHKNGFLTIVQGNLKDVFNYIELLVKNEKQHV